MKKTLLALLMVAVTATVFTGCKKEKDDKDSVSIVGNWKLVETVVSRINKGQVTSSSNVGDGGMILHGDGTYVGNFGEGTYKVVDGAGLSTTDFQGSKLRIDIGDFKEFDIVRLTSSELIIYALHMDDADNGLSVKLNFRRVQSLTIDY